MFDASTPQTATGRTGPTAGAVLDVAEVRTWTRTVAQAGLEVDDAERIDLLRALEELKCAAEGAQSVVTAGFAASQRARAAERGVPSERQDRGIAAQVALARRESPHRGTRHLALARTLADDLPCTAAALRSGRITEHKASLVAAEVACLDREDRLIVDATLAGDPARIERMGDRAAADEARRLAAELDTEAVCERRRRAESERRVTIRPAPDTMTWVTALLPVKEGVSVYAALKVAADAATAAGDPRSRGQLMADTLCRRVTERVTPDSSTTTPASPAISLGLVMTDRVLLAGGDEPGWVEGYGPVPADLARAFVRHGLDAGDRVWLRRLYTHPATGELVTMDSRQRLFRDNLAGLIRLRDRTCRTPWCDAPIRHTDHAEEAQAGGATSRANGQGLCQACNLAKQAPGWSAGQVRAGPGHEIETRTPTGHRHRSRAPALARPPFRPVRPGVWTLVA